MNVLITGGAGFIGANLSRVLTRLPDPISVTVLDDLSFGFHRNLDGLEIRFIHGSILDQDALGEAIRGAGAVVHLAARSSVPRSIAEPIAAHDVNATGTAMVLEAARAAGVGQVIVASSSSVYGANDVLPKHEGLATRPVSPYAASKLATEAYSLAWSHSYGLPVLALRLFNVYGPLQPPTHSYAAVVPAFLAAAMQDLPLPLHGDGSQTRDFTFVDSVVSVITDALIREVSSLQPVNLAFGTRVSLLELISGLEEILGRRLPIESLPVRAGDVPRSQADTATLRTLFPTIEPTALAEGLRATVEWFISSRPWEA